MDGTCAGYEMKSDRDTGLEGSGNDESGGTEAPGQRAMAGIL